jgi:hypothetical protein
LKKLLLLSVLALAIFAGAFAGSAKAGDWYCTVQAGQNCISGFNYWNHHYVLNLGGSSMFCGSYTPNGTQQGYAWVSPGEARNISAWNYNRLICTNATSQTTLHINDYF